jgi:site-specific DNA-methyltransferase (adenine-specific)
VSGAKLILGDCLDVLPGLDAGSFDAVVTDPPYHLTEPRAVDGFGSMQRRGGVRTEDEKARRRGGFMGKAWDGTGISFDPATWEAVARVMRPGSYLLAFGGARTFHHMACAIEDAGLVLQETLCWLHAQGFPKHSSKLKPAWEPILLAWKKDRRATPLPGLDSCRIGCNDKAKFPAGVVSDTEQVYANGEGRYANRPRPDDTHPSGRWPANVCLSHHAECNGACHPECPVRLLDEQAGERGGGDPRRANGTVAPGVLKFGGQGHRPFHDGPPIASSHSGYSDSGGPSRFFYCAKASKADRGEGNTHNTVKPLALMRWLCRLITPPGGTILDPFAGSGSTGLAALHEGFGFVGVEREESYFQIARRRLAAAQPPLPLEAP